MRFGELARAVAAAVADMSFGTFVVVAVVVEESMGSFAGRRAHQSSSRFDLHRQTGLEDEGLARVCHGTDLVPAVPGSRKLVVGMSRA